MQCDTPSSLLNHLLSEISLLVLLVVHTHSTITVDGSAPQGRVRVIVLVERIHLLLSLVQVVE